MISRPSSLDAGDFVVVLVWLSLGGMAWYGLQLEKDATYVDVAINCYDRYDNEIVGASCVERKFTGGAVEEALILSTFPATFGFIVGIPVIALMLYDANRKRGS